MTTLEYLILALLAKQDHHVEAETIRSAVILFYDTNMPLVVEARHKNHPGQVKIIPSVETLQVALEWMDHEKDVGVNVT